MSLITHNQVSVPDFMYGTAWKKEATSKLVELAVDSGFTAIDTANQQIHYQEALVGDALLALQKKGINRDQLFLQTKFTSIDGQGQGQPPYDRTARPANQVVQSVDSSLSHLHTDYLDSYVLHGPYSRNGLGKDDWEVWTAIEELYKAGKAKTIGISNVTAKQLSELCAQASTKPMFVQNRCYAVRGWDKDVRDICNANKIIYQGFSLLTANDRYIESPTVRAIAMRLKATVTQIIFRFAMQVGMLPLTGTTNVQHMTEDLQSAKFDLSAGDIQLIETIGI